MRTASDRDWPSLHQLGRCAISLIAIVGSPVVEEGVRRNRDRLYQDRVMFEGKATMTMGVLTARKIEL